MYSIDNHITVFFKNYHASMVYKVWARTQESVRSIVYITVSELRENKNYEFVADKELFRFSSFDQQYSPA